MVNVCHLALYVRGTVAKRGLRTFLTKIWNLYPKVNSVAPDQTAPQCGLICDFTVVSF